jgi:hypothetical protein
MERHSTMWNRAAREAMNAFHIGDLSTPVWERDEDV